MKLIFSVFNSSGYSLLFTKKVFSTVLVLLARVVNYMLNQVLSNLCPVIRTFRSSSSQLISWTFVV